MDLVPSVVILKPLLPTIKDLVTLHLVSTV